MIKTSTKNDLIPFLYGEANARTSQHIHSALISQPEFCEEVEQLQEIVNALDHTLLSAPTRVTKNILAYSADCSLESV